MSAVEQAWLLERQCELQALVSEREGMVAENLHRQHCGHSIAYGEEAFAQNASAIQQIANTIHEARQA